MKTENERMNDALLNLIMIDRELDVHEGVEHGTGWCNETCLTNVAIDAHNDAVIYLRSLYGGGNA